MEKDMKFGRKIKYLIIYLSLILFCSIGCKKSGPVEPPDPPQPLPDDLALFASIDGNWCGIQVFNANSLEKIDSLETTPGVPFSIEFSPDYSKWYTIWHDNNDNYVLYAIDAKTKAIIRSINVTGQFLHMLKNKNILVTTAGKLRFWNADNFNLIKEDSIGMDRMIRLISSPINNKMYAARYTGIIPEIVVYNIETFNIERTINLSDSTKPRSLAFADLEISPDGRLLFVTVFNWNIWSGIFFAIDLSTYQIVAELPCGSFSQIGVSSDGHYVYITDPAGYFYMMEPTAHLLRYNIHARSMEVFINGLRDIGLTGNMLMITDQVVIAPDNRTMFLTFMGDAKTTDGKQVHIIKLDILTKKVLCVYSIPPDYRGYVTQRIAQLKLGRYRQ